MGDFLNYLRIWVILRNDYIPWGKKKKYRIFSNLIRTSFCRYLKWKKKLVRGSNPHLSFNRPLPTRQTDWIILDVTNALTIIWLMHRVWSSDWVTDNDSVMSDDGESDE